MPDTTTLIGIAASVCTGAALLPQLIKICKEKKCSVSPLMLGVLFSGNALWVWYGIRKEDMIIIISNSFSILINLSLSMLWVRFRGGLTQKK